MYPILSPAGHRVLYAAKLHLFTEGLSLSFVADEAYEADRWLNMAGGTSLDPVGC